MEPSKMDREGERRRKSSGIQVEGKQYFGSCFALGFKAWLAAGAVRFMEDSFEECYRSSMLSPRFNRQLDSGEICIEALKTG